MALLAPPGYAYVCAVSCALHRFGLLLYCRRFVQYVVRNCKSTFMQLWKCFTVSPFPSACLVIHQTTIKKKASDYNED